MAARSLLLSRVAEVGLRRPGLVLSVVAVIVVLSAVLIPGIEVSTSRYGLVSRDNPFQARMFDFFERFGYPDTPVMLVRADDVEQRRRGVDRLVELLEQDPQLEGRVLARMTPEQLAEVVLVNAPELIEGAAGSLPKGTTLSDLLGGGLPSWIGIVEQQLYAGLEGEGDPEQAEAGLDHLTTLADAFGAYLDGDEVLDRVSELSGDAVPQRPGIDALGYLVTGDERFNVVTMFPELPGDEVADLGPLVDRLRDIRDEAVAGSDGVEILLTGLPALAVDERRMVERGLMTSSAAASVGIFLLCFVLFRSLTQTVFALAPLGVGLVITLAATRLIYGELNQVTSAFIAVILGLGIDFSVHALSRYHEQLRSGRSSEDSVRDAMQRSGRAIVTGAVTTAIAFITLAGGEFTAYGELGVVTAVGLAAIVLATFFVLPPVLGHLGRRGLRAAPEPFFVRHVPPLLRSLRWPLLGTGVALAIAGALSIPHVEFNPRYFDFLPTTEESSAALLELERDPVASPIFAQVTAGGVEEAREMAQRLRDLDSVAGVQTATDLLPPLDDGRLARLRKALAGLDKDPDLDALGSRKTSPSELLPKVKAVIDALDEVRFALKQGDRDTAAAEKAKQALEALAQRLERPTDGLVSRLGTLEAHITGLLRRAWTTTRAVAERGGYEPGDLPPLFRRRFVSKDGSELALYVIPAGEFWDLEVAGKFVADLESIDPNASGLAMNHHAHSNMIVRDFRRAAALTAVLIYIVLALDFRSLTDALLAVVPAALGWLWMFGVMAVLGLRFDVANVVSLPLVFGIGIAAGVHLMHRCRESAAARGGRAHLDDLVRGTGGAVVVAALTTMAGFAGLMVSEHLATFTLGLVMTIGIGLCLVASLLVLPPILLALRRVE